nr:immunoglobulin light chain junction region [Macaca mulatta]MOX57879.1 immunoglobulin light chain junction region [Macaca mulatta]
CMQHIYIPPTI